MRNRYPFLQRDHNRFGTVVWYFRRDRGLRIRIRGEYGSPEFKAAYDAAFRGELPGPVAPAESVAPVAPAARQKIAAPDKDSLEWLFRRFRESSTWKGLSNSTRRSYELVLVPIMDEHGTQKYKLLKKAQIEKSLEKRKDTPHAQRHFHNAISETVRVGERVCKYIDEDPNRL